MIAATTTPKPAPEPPLKFRRGMVDVATVSALCGQSEDGVLEMVLDGRLSHAWNLASSKSQRMYLRILGRSVIDLVAGQNTIDASAAALPAVIAMLFPSLNALAISGGNFSNAKIHVGDTVTNGVSTSTIAPSIDALRIARTCSLSSTHVINLISEGSLLQPPGSPKPKSGPNGSPLVLRSSLAQLLIERRVT